MSQITFIIAKKRKKCTNESVAQLRHVLDQESSTHLTEGSVRSLEIKLKHVAKQGQSHWPWGLLSHFLGGEVAGDKAKDEQDNNSPQQGGGIGSEEENKIIKKSHRFSGCRSPPGARSPIA